jgi:hypothetical protein
MIQNLVCELLSSRQYSAIVDNSFRKPCLVAAELLFYRKTDSVRLPKMHFVND